ncbi:MAG: hypothetical protein JWP44_623 [Mucilaginibacter sp.]|nr:hypothetical protein [Mucilaginibacter sp.]
MILLQADVTQNLSILLLILLVLSMLILIAKRSAAKSNLKNIISKLTAEFPNLESFLEKKKSFAVVATALKKRENVPEIITIRYLMIMAEDVITTGILPDIHSADKENYNKRIFLLDEVSKRFNVNRPNKLKTISEINEKRNTFYIAKQVFAEIQSPGATSTSQNGILILGLHYLMFFPSAELTDHVDFERIEELLLEVTDKVPLLNMGISGAFVVKDINENTEEEKPLFSEKLKKKFTDLVNENKGFLIRYYDFEKIHYAGAGERISGLAKFSITLNNSLVYKFWKFNDNLELIDTIFEGTLSLALMNGNMLLPKSLKDGNNYVSFYKVK